jgi:hypothetical protein
MTTRQIGDGGAQERVIEAKYRRHAEAMALLSPRTARLLREIAETYADHASREDIRAELEEEISR